MGCCVVLYGKILTPLPSLASLPLSHSMTFTGREFKAFFDVALDQGARLELTEGVGRREEALIGCY